MSNLKIYYEHISNFCTQTIPKRIGAYVITHTFDNIHAEKYVGSTKNLYNRICGHYDKVTIYIDLYITDDIYLAECLERVLMELINPATNKRISSLSDNDKELMNELLEDTDIKEHLSNNIIKIGCRYLKCVNRKIILGEHRTLSKKWKILRINDETHKTITNKIEELETQYGVHVTIESLVGSILMEGIKGYDILKR